MQTRPTPTEDPRPKQIYAPEKNFLIEGRFQVIKKIETGNKIQNYPKGPKINSPRIFGG